eukprot:TRINITY_DN1225_c0_g2_i1.p1 TRINITY_DN1225_c0_g2~~TRINITY_DN1225_c0_g2_i1.p1  ORF type:complete len:412 (+),score=119.20 TRINITY_DN1225_c0_g2_i1:53-1237(+)
MSMSVFDAVVPVDVRYQQPLHPPLRVASPTLPPRATTTTTSSTSTSLISPSAIATAPSSSMSAVRVHQRTDGSDGKECSAEIQAILTSRGFLPTFTHSSSMPALPGAASLRFPSYHYTSQQPHRAPLSYPHRPKSSSIFSTAPSPSSSLPPSPLVRPIPRAGSFDLFSLPQSLLTPQQRSSSSSSTSFESESEEEGVDDGEGASLEETTSSDAKRGSGVRDEESSDVVLETEDAGDSDGESREDALAVTAAAVAASGRRRGVVDDLDEQFDLVDTVFSRTKTPLTSSSEAPLAKSIRPILGRSTTVFPPWDHSTSSSPASLSPSHRDGEGEGEDVLSMTPPQRTNNPLPRNSPFWDRARTGICLGLLSSSPPPPRDDPERILRRDRFLHGSRRS